MLQVFDKIYDFCYIGLRLYQVSIQLVKITFFLLISGFSKSGYSLYRLFHASHINLLHSPDLSENNFLLHEQNVIAFTYRRNGELVNCKFRSITSRKFWQAVTFIIGVYNWILILSNVLMISFDVSSWFILLHLNSDMIFFSN